MHYRNDADMVIKVGGKKTSNWMMALAAAFVMFIILPIIAFGCLVIFAEDESIEAYWDDMTLEEQLELCIDYNKMGEDGMRELLEVFGTLSERQEIEFDQMIEVAEAKC